MTITGNNNNNNNGKNTTTKNKHKCENIDNIDNQNTNNRQWRNNNFRMKAVSKIKWTELSKYTFSSNFIYLLRGDGALSAHIKGDYDKVSWYKLYYQKDKLDWIGKKILFWRQAQQKYPRFNISAKKDPPPQYLNRCFQATVI